MEIGQEKLIRDGYSQIIEPGRWRIAAPHELPRLLREKFWEELAEVKSAPTRLDQMTELGDLLEVIETMEHVGADSCWHRWLYTFHRQRLHHRQIAVDAARWDKKRELGGFSRGLVLCS